MSAPQQKRGLAMASLVVGVLSIPSLGCLGLGALAGIVLGVLALMKAKGSPEEYGGKGLAIGGIVCSVLSLLLIPVIGIVAAIAIPSLLRARVSANEAAAIGDVRTVISAEAAYSSANGGFHDSLSCLGAPSGCIPNYKGPVFLSSEMAAAAPRHGYRFRLQLGPAAQAEGPVSPTSAEVFAYLAVPVNPGQTGVRSFCGDSTGRVCSTIGAEPAIVDGVCAPDCTDLR